MKTQLEFSATDLSITQHFNGRKGEKLDKTYYCFKTNMKTYWWYKRSYKRKLLKRYENC